MAEVTEISGVSAEIPPLNGSDKKRPRGRPRKCEECGESLDPTVPHVCLPEEPAPAQPAEDDEPKDFWLTLANYTDDDWKYLNAYLYRLMPKIDRKSSGQAAHVQLYVSPFTQEDIMKEHGSGLYQIYLNRQDPKSGKAFRVAVYKFPIMNPKFPPVVPAGEWVDDKINDPWKWGAPASVTSTSSATVAGYPPGFSMDRMLDREQKMFERGLELARENSPKPKDDSALITLLTELIKNQPEPPKPDTSANDALLKFLEKQNDRLAAEIKELRTAPVQTAPKSNLMELINELKPALEFLGQKPRGEWYEAPIVEKIGEGVAEAIPGVIELIKGHQAQQQRQQQPQGWAQPNPGLPAPQTQTQQPPPQAPPAAATATVPQPDPQPQLTEQQKMEMKHGPFIMFVSPQMIEHFKADEDGHGGYHFRDWVCRMHGLLRWGDLKREIGAAHLLAMIAAYQPLAVELSPESERTRFIQEFFTAEGEEEQDEEDGAPIDLGGAGDVA